MGNYYLDIETTGLNPETCGILTIQFQELDRFTGEAKGKLIILKSWESSEKEIIEGFLRLSNILDIDRFSFVPHGYNLGFEHKFLMRRAEIHGLPKIDILGSPFVDLHHIGILMNNGEFKGSGLDKITEKKGQGRDVLEMHSFGDYDKIEAYIRQEARAYIKFHAWLRKRMPELLREFKGE